MTATLAGEHVAVLGLARSGLAAARLALARGATVYASDSGDTPRLRSAAEEIEAAGGAAEVGGHDLERLAAADWIVLSPGIPPTIPILKDPAVRDVEVIAEMEFAFRELGAPVVAITGTNGKTTVTSLTTHLLRAAGFDAVAGGNIGTALSDLALRDPQPEVVVVEASSFQLGGIRSFSPAIGVFTNLAPDHLDWYDSVADYYADKARIFENASAASRWVLNGEDDEVRKLIGKAPGERYWFRIESPLAVDERGGWISEDGWLTLRLADGADRRLLRASDLRILGPHNAANALAASIAAVLFGASRDAVAEGLRTFEALEHRMEPVLEKDGVLWINDSKATNVASTEMGLRSLTRPVILLLGGRHKGEPYSDLLPAMQGRVRCVLAYGEAAGLIREDLEGKVPLEVVDGSFEEVVQRAASMVEPGDAVLLAPACSSYDMFENYEERGRRFRDLVRGAAG